MSELRGLGGLVMEQALLDRDARPQASVVRWADRLAAELGFEDTGMPADYPELLQAIVRIMQSAKADPERPMIALPPAA